MERHLKTNRIKNVAKKNIDPSLDITFLGQSTDFLRDFVEEFIQLISLAAIDRSEKSKAYIDSGGLVNALIDLGFEDLLRDIPDLSDVTEDMHKI